MLKNMIKRISPRCKKQFLVTVSFISIYEYCEYYSYKKQFIHMLPPNKIDELNYRSYPW